MNKILRLLFDRDPHATQPSPLRPFTQLALFHSSLNVNSKDRAQLGDVLTFKLGEEQFEERFLKNEELGKGENELKQGGDKGSKEYLRLKKINEFMKDVNLLDDKSTDESDQVFTR